LTAPACGGGAGGTDLESAGDLVAPSGAAAGWAGGPAGFAGPGPEPGLGGRGRTTVGASSNGGRAAGGGWVGCGVGHIGGLVGPPPVGAGK